MGDTEVTVTYSEPLIRKAILHHWLRLIGWSGFVFLALCLAWLLYLFYSDQRDWLFGLVMTIAALQLIIYPSIYFSLLRRSMSVFRAMESPTAVFGFSDTGLRLTTSLGSSTVKGTGIMQVWQFTGAWLIFFNKSQSAILPTAGLTNETRSYVLERVRTNGGKIG